MYLRNACGLACTLTLLVSLTPSLHPPAARASWCLLAPSIHPTNYQLQEQSSSSSSSSTRMLVGPLRTASILAFASDVRRGEGTWYFCAYVSASASASVPPSPSSPICLLFRSTHTHPQAHSRWSWSSPNARCYERWVAPSTQHPAKRGQWTCTRPRRRYPT
jgi:hypothetical protein